MEPIRFIIRGQPCSKANSRQIVLIGGKPKVIKSEAALAYECDALRQVPPKARQRIEGPVSATLHLYYGSHQPDLDESIVLDVLQDRWSKRDKFTKERQLLQSGVYRNDRQVREKHVYHHIDKREPRAEVEIHAIAPQQGEDMFTALEREDEETF